MKNVRQGIVIVCVIAGVFPVAGTSAVAAGVPELCGRLVVAVDVPDVAMLERLVGQGRSVQVLQRDKVLAARLREGAAERWPLPRLGVREWDGAHLPYADRLVNQIICFGRTPAVAELLRVCAPYGRICVPASAAELLRGNPGVSTVSTSGGWAIATVAYPETIDAWTHWLYEATGNAVSSDMEVGPPCGLRWLSGPRWARSHNRNNPWAAFDGELGGKLQLRDKEDGRLRQELTLDAPPVFDGLAIGVSGIFASLKDGTLVNFRSR